jgi:hypothetical protein
MDQWRHGWEDTGVRWRALKSLASGHAGARHLADEGAKERGECGEPISGLTGAQATVWWLGNGNEAVAEGGLGDSGV